MASLSSDGCGTERKANRNAAPHDEAGAIERGSRAAREQHRDIFMPEQGGLGESPPPWNASRGRDVTARGEHGSSLLGLRISARCDVAPRGTLWRDPSRSPAGEIV